MSLKSPISFNNKNINQLETLNKLSLMLAKLNNNANMINNQVLLNDLVQLIDECYQALLDNLSSNNDCLNSHKTLNDSLFDGNSYIDNDNTDNNDNNGVNENKYINDNHRNANDNCFNNNSINNYQFRNTPPSDKRESKHQMFSYQTPPPSSSFAASEVLGTPVSKIIRDSSASNSFISTPLDINIDLNY